MTRPIERAYVDSDGAWLERRLTADRDGSAILSDLPASMAWEDITLLQGRARPSPMSSEPTNPDQERLERKRQLEQEERGDARVRDHWERLMEIYRVRMAQAWLEADRHPEELSDWLEPLRQAGTRLAEARNIRRRRLAELSDRLDRPQEARSSRQMHLQADPDSVIRVGYREPRVRAHFFGWAELKGRRLQVQHRVRLQQHTGEDWMVRELRSSERPLASEPPRFVPLQLAAQRGPAPGDWTSQWDTGPRSSPPALHAMDIALPTGGPGAVLELSRDEWEGHVETEWWPGFGTHPHEVFRPGLDLQLPGSFRVYRDGSFLGSRCFGVDGALPLQELRHVRLLESVEAPDGGFARRRVLRVRNDGSKACSLVCWFHGTGAVLRAEPDLEPDPDGRPAQRLWLAPNSEVEAVIHTSSSPEGEP